MFSIACLSQKGGVGKSTLAQLIARTYAAGSWRVKIADINTKQLSSVDWAANRMTNAVEPQVDAAPHQGLRQAIAGSSGYDLIIFDGKPDSDIGTLEIARAADLIVIPTGVTGADIVPQIRFGHELKNRGIEPGRLLFILNKTTDSQNWIDAARVALTEQGFRVAATDLPVKTGYMAAQNSGRALSETTFPSLNERAEALAQEVVARLAELSDA